MAALGYAWIPAALVISIVIFILIVGWCLVRKQPRSLRMKAWSWLSFEAEWKDDDKNDPHAEDGDETGITPAA